MKKQLKTFEASRGVALDPDFEQHTKVCEKCAAFDPQRPATATALCLEGAVLWKRDNVVTRRRESLPGDSNRVSKDRRRAVMRYKE